MVMVLAFACTPVRRRTPHAAGAAASARISQGVWGLMEAIAAPTSSAPAAKRDPRRPMNGNANAKTSAFCGSSSTVRGA